MLVLSRKIGEKLVIDGNITVVVQKVSGNRVTLGVEAPDSVRIVRGELLSPMGSDRPNADASIAPAGLGKPAPRSSSEQLASGLAK